MRNFSISSENLWTYLVAGAVPVLVYLSILLIPIPPSLSRIFWSYSFPTFLLALFLYFICFRLSGIYGWLASACLTMLFLGLTLSFLWRSGYSDDKIIGGLLPFRDGFDYYNGARLILSGHVITNINEGAAWRPLYPGFLSALLWITGKNLQWALVIQAGLAGICCALSAYHVRNWLGAAAASVYMTLIFFYIQPLIGTAYTETLGLALGSLGLVVLATAAKSRRKRDLVFGLVILMIAVSERAGTFFIFPLLILWGGWAFRRAGRFSFRFAGLALGAAAATYLMVNTIFNKVMVEPGSFPFGNFAFTIYGQVAGGAGYHKAFEDLGVRNPALILRAAGRSFLAHPFSFFIGAAKAYRDFFSPQAGALGFGSTWGGILLWIAGTVMLLIGLYKSARNISSPESSLLIASFIGILLSIPFLPPIDGGIRIYASTMPFFFALPAAAFDAIWPKTPQDEMSMSLIRPAGGLSILLIILTVFAPVLILYLTSKPIYSAGVCPAEQLPYAAIVSAGSYIDLVPEGTGSCGSLPEVCLADFQKYRKTKDPSDVAAYDELISLADETGARIFPAEDLIGARPHLFVAAARQLNVPNNSVITGCAAETRVAGRPSIYSIRTIK